jgi:hypothetical protein
MQTNFLGRNGITWWIGRIENRADPLGLGRCQVRIFGFHGDFTDTNSPALINIPATDLPWALPIYPVNNSKTFSAPMLGEWVVGFFLDGESGQAPIMWGVIPGYSQVESPNEDTSSIGPAPDTTSNSSSNEQPTDTGEESGT